MDNLISWARDHGATFEAVPSADQPRKLFAAKDLAPGDVIFSIPQRLLVYGARAYDDPEYGPAFRQLQEEVGDVLDQRSLLVLLLVLERCRGQHSFFAPYCNILPSSYDDPFWWSDAELVLLQGSRLHKAVGLYTSGLQQLHSWLTRLEQLHQQHLQEQLQPQEHPLPQGQQQKSTLSTAAGGWGLTLEAVKWSRSAVWSRAFTVKGLDIGSNRQQHCVAPGSGQGGEGGGSGAGEAIAPADNSGGDDGAAAGCVLPVIALVPVLDMCDHHPQQRVSWRVTGGQASQEQQQQQQQQQEVIHTQQQDQQQQQLQGQQAFQMTSLSPVSKGAELFNNYGTNKPNEELLLGFGFVLDQNPNDSFLVSISHPRSGHSDDDDSSSTADEAACDEAAMWQRRLAAMAAFGLKLDVPITAAEPLPDKLLDVMLLAAAMPAWRVGTLLLPAQQAKPCISSVAADGRIGGGGGSSAAASSGADEPHQQHQQPVVSLFASAPLQEQLQVLLLLQQQLAAKLQGMLPEEQLLQLLHKPPHDNQQGGSGALGALNPDHARLAAVYVLSQQQVLKVALQAVLLKASDCLQKAATANASLLQSLTPVPAPAAGPSGSAAASGAGGAPGASSDQGVTSDAVRLHEQLQLCPCCNVLSVKPGAGITPGSVLLQAPLDCCLAAKSETGLILQLMLRVMDQPQQQQKEQTVTLSTSACSFFSQHWRQQQQQGVACGAEQVLPWWLLSDYQELVSVLQDTPAGQQLLERSEEMQGGFHDFVDALRGSAAAAATMAADAATDAQQGGMAAAGSTAVQQQQQILLQAVQEQPQRMFRMFCWAHQLVQQATTSVQLSVADTAVSEQQTIQQQQLLLVPGLERIPKVLRDLVITVNLHGSAEGQEEQEQQQQQHQGQVGSQVTVVCKCSLPAGLQLGHNLTAPGSSAQQMLLERGPRALCAAAAAAAATAATAPGVNGSAASVTTNATNSSSSMVAAVQHAYELLLAPPEDDAVRPQKLQLLSCTGLGLCHYLTMSCCDATPAAAVARPAGDSQGARVPLAADSSSAQRHQQQQREAVLTAMALCLLAEGSPAHSLLLQPGVHGVVEGQRHLLQTAGVLSTAAGAQSQPAASTAVMPALVAAAAGEGNGSESVATMDRAVQGVSLAPTGSNGAWEQLQQQVLQQAGKEARKQLLQVLKDDRRAFRAAQKQLQAVPHVQEHAGQQLPDDGAGGPCSCGLAAQQRQLSPMTQAVAGIGLYLQGQLQLLDCWMGLLQGSNVDKKAQCTPSSKKTKGDKEFRGSGGSKHKKARQG